MCLPLSASVVRSVHEKLIEVLDIEVHYKLETPLGIVGVGTGRVPESVPAPTALTAFSL